MGLINTCGTDTDTIRANQVNITHEYFIFLRCYSFSLIRCMQLLYKDYNDVTLVFMRLI